MNSDFDDIQIIKLLLHVKADIDYGGFTKKTGIPENPACISLPPITMTAQFGKLESNKVLLEAGAEIDVATGDGAFAMHLATEKGHIVIVWLLVEKGADAAGGAKGR